MKVRNWKAVRREAVDTGRIDDTAVETLREELLAQVRAYKLAEVRVASGLSQQDLAKQLQVSQSRISRIEHGDLA